MFVFFCVGVFESVFLSLCFFVCVCLFVSLRLFVCVCVCPRARACKKGKATGETRNDSSPFPLTQSRQRVQPFVPSDVDGESPGDVGEGEAEKESEAKKRHATLVVGDAHQGQYVVEKVDDEGAEQSEYSIGGKNKSLKRYD